MRAKKSVKTNSLSLSDRLASASSSILSYESRTGHVAPTRYYAELFKVEAAIKQASNTTGGF